MTNLINKISDSTKITFFTMLFAIFVVACTFIGLRDYDYDYNYGDVEPVILYSDECGWIQGVKEHESLCEVENG